MSGAAADEASRTSRTASLLYRRPAASATRGAESGARDRAQCVQAYSWARVRDSLSCVVVGGPAAERTSSRRLGMLRERTGWSQRLCCFVRWDEAREKKQTGRMIYLPPSFPIVGKSLFEELRVVVKSDEVVLMDKN